MQKLLIRILVMALLIICTNIIIFIAPTKSFFVFATIVDKHKLLSESTSPKIVFIGGSSLALGLDSTLIHKKTGLPVVNMGLNGGLGLRYMMNEVLTYIKSGDIIILTPEYDHFQGTLLNGDLNLLWVIQIMPRNLSYLSSWEQYRICLSNIPRFLKEKTLELLTFSPDPVYNRKAFNKYGDFVGHRNLNPAQALGGIHMISREPINERAFAAVEQFVTAINKRGARVVFIFPPLAQVQYQLDGNKEAIKKIYNKLRGIINLYIPSNPSEYIFPNKLFFDTVYHLNGIGVEIRSRKIVRDLSGFLNTTNHQARLLEAVLGNE